MKKLFRPLFLLLTGSLFAQDYKAVDPNRAYVFSYNQTGVNYDVAGFKVETVKPGAGGDTNFFNHTYERRNGYFCYAPLSIWIGPEVISTSTEDVFFNKNQEAIRLKRNAKLGEEWTSYVSNNEVVKATVSAITWEDNLEGYDSVKTISFAVYAPDLSALNYQLNGLTVKISKKKGFVRTINFNEFPGAAPAQVHRLQTYNILGASNPTAGVAPITKAAIYDFQPGDEFHTREVFVFKRQPQDNYDTTNIISKVISREETEDSLFLTFYEETEEIRVSDAGYKWRTRNAKSATTYKRLSKNEVLLPGGQGSLNDDVFLPGKEINRYDDLSFFTQRYENGQQKLLVNLQGAGKEFASDGTFCLTKTLCFNSYDNQYYLVGLGGPYFNSRGCATRSTSWTRNLVYYRKGIQTEVGNPLKFEQVITGLEETSFENSISIHPNPFTDELHVPAGVSHLHITDVSGQIQLEQTLSGNGQSVNTTALPAGLYIATVKDVSGKPTTFKLMKK